MTHAIHKMADGRTFRVVVTERQIGPSSEPTLAGRRELGMEARAGAVLQRRDDRTQALVEAIGELTSMGEPRRHLTALMTGLDIHYELGEGHPLLGRRMPDLDVTTSSGARRVGGADHLVRAADRDVAAGLATAEGVLGV